MRQKNEDEIFRMKLELENKKEESLEAFKKFLKDEEEKERSKLKTNHELAIKSKCYKMLLV